MINRHRPSVRSSYLHHALEPAKVRPFIAAAVKLLRGKSFEAIAFRGMSGAVVAPLLAYSMNKSLIMVRKPEDKYSSHATLPVEGDINAANYIIVDDCVATGRTIRTILAEVEIFAPEAQCIGVLLYYDFVTRHRPLELISPTRYTVRDNHEQTTTVELVREIPF